MNAFNISRRNIRIFFKEIVAGVKKGFTFALPIATRICKKQAASKRGKHKIEMIRPQGQTIDHQVL